MYYDLLITEIKNPKARTILARQLAKSPKITLQQAYQMMEKLPIILFKNINEITMQNYVAQYYNLGVTLKAIECTTIKEKQKNCSIPSVLDKPKTLINRREAIINELITFKQQNRKKKSIHLILKNISISKKLFVILFSISITLLAIIILNKKASSIWNVKGILQKNNYLKEIQNVKFQQKNENLSSRKKLSIDQKRTSEVMSDSAKRFDTDLKKMINFYKIAISFNKYNLNAWFGLLSAYKHAKIEDSYLQCLNDMNTIFGKQVFTISGVVNKYGSISDNYISEDSALVISYKTTARLDEPVLWEIYSIIKALSSQQGKESITISAGYSKNKEIIVHVRPGMNLETFDNFKTNASINIFK